ncbi:MAG: hypothetical protein RRY95_03035 [Oscillospiraceae bacterium]
MAKIRKERKAKNKTPEKPQYHWILRIFLISMALSIVLSLLSETALEGAGYALAIGVLLLFILLGIGFDIIGVAVTAADVRPFHSMAAHKEKGAAEALSLLRNASHVSSFCNDVVGDICGIVSGSTAAIIVTRLERDLSTHNIFLSVLVTAVISGLTIGGKALGKSIAMQNSTGVVHTVARFMHIFHRAR